MLGNFSRVDSTPMGSTVGRLGLELTGNQVRRLGNYRNVEEKRWYGRSPIDSRRPAYRGTGNRQSTPAAPFRDFIHVRIDRIHRPTAKGGKIVPIAFLQKHAREELVNSVAEIQLRFYLTLRYERCSAK